MVVVKQEVLAGKEVGPVVVVHIHPHRAFIWARGTGKSDCRVGAVGNLREKALSVEAPGQKDQGEQENVSRSVGVFGEYFHQNCRSHAGKMVIPIKFALPEGNERPGEGRNLYFWFCENPPFMPPQPSFDTWTIIFLFAAVQGYFMALVLLVWRRGDRLRGDRLLALLMLLFALTDPNMCCTGPIISDGIHIWRI